MHFPFGAFRLFELSICLMSKEPDFSLLELVVLLEFCIIMTFLSLPTWFYEDWVNSEAMLLLRRIRLLPFLNLVCFSDHMDPFYIFTKRKRIMFSKWHFIRSRRSNNRDWVINLLQDLCRFCHQSLNYFVMETKLYHKMNKWMWPRKDWFQTWITNVIYIDWKSDKH